MGWNRIEDSKLENEEKERQRKSWEESGIKRRGREYCGVGNLIKQPGEKEKARE